MDITGPGFINMKLSDTYVQKKIYSMLRDEEGRLGIASKANTSQQQRVIVDFSSPNIAKEMHVGHLRSTIIGDSLSRILQFLGHDVLRLNHVGDWGTQFGMLIHYLNINSDSGSRDIGDLVEFYKKAKILFDEDLQFQEAARREVVKLQTGDPETVDKWKKICDLSRVEFNKIYDTLNIKIEERGESFYNPFLASIVNELIEKKHAVDSEGATCIFLDNESYINADGTKQPLLVKKSDGGYLYATTDLAAVRHRAEVEKADRVLYVTDIGQSQHFQMVFDACKQCGIVDATKTKLTHVPFGLVLGEDGKKFKTRSGDTVKLKDLLDEAVRIASEDMLSRSEQKDELTADEAFAAKVIGIGAVKYADLSMNRESNYRFSYKKMLSLSGNTAPYMIYAFVRIQGIKRKIAAELGGGEDKYFKDIHSNTIRFEVKEEVALAKQLIKLDEVLCDIESNLYPNKMCDYIFELSQKFNQFYEQCPVIKASDEDTQKSRAVLCALSADTLKVCLGLLGIDTVYKL